MNWAALIAVSAGALFSTLAGCGAEVGGAAATVAATHAAAASQAIAQQAKVVRDVEQAQAAAAVRAASAAD